MRKLLSHISCWLLAATGLVACTEEDLSMCNPGVKLQLQYVLNSEQTDLFGPEVGRADAYVFDSDGLYVGIFTDQGEHLVNDYVMFLPLRPGEYTVVVWGYENDASNYDRGCMYDAQSNALEDELQIGVTTIEDFRLMLRHNSELPPAAGRGAANAEPAFLVDESPDDLFYGLVAGAVSKPNPLPQQVGLVKNTNTINVIIEGLDAFADDPQSELPEIYITAQDGLYNYRNEIPDSAARLMYTPYNNPARDGDTMEAKITVMRLMTQANAAGPAILSVSDPATGTVFFEGDVVEALMQVKDGEGNYPYRTQEDLDRYDEFTFRIRVDAEMNVTVWINGWEVKEITPEL